ncbi:hypothetical protein R1sor_002995 [Riccia sorocarpa]|uniref:Uncharacterized protein n=1 Tax=Riccia sorocarpa TaxID=122646 RepID=A0ABD3H0Q4_9MARC
MAGGGKKIKKVLRLTTDWDRPEISRTQVVAIPGLRNPSSFKGLAQGYNPALRLASRLGTDRVLTKRVEELRAENPMQEAKK